MQADGAAPADGAADDAAPSEARMSALMSDALFAGFETHVERLKAARKRRQEVLAFKGALEMDASTAETEGGVDQTQDELDGLGVRLPTDRWQGDVNMRTLEKLLARVDARGYERYAHANPLRFSHALRTASLRCSGVSRALAALHASLRAFFCSSVRDASISAYFFWYSGSAHFFFSAAPMDAVLRARH